MDDDEDEELLLLRIKALKSTPRVNISVEFTSDSDNDLSIVKRKKQYEGNNTKTFQPACSPLSNEDDEERKLREIALSSLRRPTTRQSKKVIVESKKENQSTTIHISQDVSAVVTTDPGSYQEVLITSCVFPEPRLQESSAIQHDLISSTSGDTNGAHPTSDHLTPSCVVETTVTEKLSCSQSPTINLTNDQSKLTCNEVSDKLLQCNVIEGEKPSTERKDLGGPKNDVGEKLPTPNEDVVKNDTTQKEESASISEDHEQETIKSTPEGIMEKMYPPVAEECIPPEFGNYSPSSPSEAEIDTEAETEGEVDTMDHNCRCDDVLSLCTSDKDANELVSMSPVNELQEDTEVTCSDTNLQSKYLTCEEKQKPSEVCNEKSDSDNEINSSCPDEDPVNSNASGLNIILDRYLNEVAANKKKKVNVCTEDEDEYCYSSDELGIVNSCRHLSGKTNKSQEIGDCKPGPSGYVKPTIIHGYGSESEESLIDTTPTGTSKGMLTAVNTKVDGEEKDNSSSTDIKCALEEKNTHEDEDEHVKDATCSVCLGPFENRAFLNLCFHSFCYMCIIQWSELSRLCPLCKTKYTSLIHSVNTDLDYETHEFPDDIPILDRDDGSSHRREFSETMDDGRRFRYRSTVVDHEEWATRKIERERMEQEYMRSRQQRRMKRRLKWSTTKDMRKSVYQKGLQVKEVKQRGNSKYRDISPEFFAENPALKHRLVPWLLRDLNVLLGNEDENIRFVMSLILNLISKLSMREGPFKEQLRPFLFEQTDHFVAELVSFASSPYDIRGYDSNVKYCTAENDVEIVSISKPAIQVNDDESSGEKKELSLLEEVFLADQEGEGLLGDNGIEDISLEASTKGDLSPVPTLKTNGFENISPVDSDAGEVKIKVEEEEAADAVNGNDVVAGKDKDEGIKTEEQSESEESQSEGPRRRKKDGRKEKKKRRKRKRKRSEIGKSRKKKKSSKKESAKKSGKMANISGTSLPNEDSGAAFLLKDEKELICEEKDDAVENGLQIKVENTKSDASSSHMNLNKKESTEKERKEEKRKRKREEQRRKRKHKKKYKHIKRVKRKRRRIRSSSSEDDNDMDFKVSNKSKKNTESASSKKTDTEESDFPLQKRNHNKRGVTSEKEEKSPKKGLKRKSTSSGTERVPKRRKKEKNKNTPDAKNKRRKKDRKKKKKKHKHRKSSVAKGHNPVPMETGVNVGNGEVDNELRSKIDHAINAIMVTKGGTNSSDDEDEFLNSQEVQDLLTKYKYNDKLDLIKDGDAYKTRAEVVHELLLIEKAITRRKEKKQKQKQKTDTSKTVSLNGETATSNPDGKKPNSELQTDKAIKKAEREKSYKVLIQELQEIEGRINSCRSSLQAKPTGMI